MAIDPSIALGVKPVQITSQEDYLKDIYAMQNAQQANQLNRMKMDEYSRGMAQDEAIRNDLANAKSSEDVVNTLNKYGKTKEAADYAYRTAETGKVGAEVKNLGYTGEKTQLESALKRFDTMGQAFGYVRNNPTPQAAGMTLKHLRDAGIIDDAKANELWQQVMADPTKIKDMADMAFTSTLQAKDQLLNFSSQNLGGTVRQIGVNPITGVTTVAPGSEAKVTATPGEIMSNARIASEGALNRANAEKVAKLRNSGDLTDEQNLALYGPNGAVTLGKLDPYKINSRNSHILANAYLSNPTTDMNKLASDAAMMRSAPTMNRAYTTEQLPTIISNVVEAGKKVGYNDNKYFGKVQEYLNGVSNDPDFVNYMTQRNDALLTITSIMRGNGATDQAHRAEIEAAPSTMSPRAFDAWAAAQMKALEPRLKQANKFTRSAPAAPANAPTGIDVNAIDAELAKRGHK